MIFINSSIFRIFIYFLPFSIFTQEFSRIYIALFFSYFALCFLVYKASFVLKSPLYRTILVALLFTFLFCSTISSGSINFSLLLYIALISTSFALTSSELNIFLPRFRSDFNLCFYSLPLLSFFIDTSTVPFVPDFLKTISRSNFSLLTFSLFSLSLLSSYAFRNRRLLLINTSFLLFILLFTGSRQFFLVVTLSFILPPLINFFSQLFKLSFSRALLSRLILIFSAISLAYACLFFFGEHLYSSYNHTKILNSLSFDFQSYSDIKRLSLLYASIEEIKGSPLLGIGLGNSQFIGFENISFIDTNISLHNSYLLLSTELGIPFLILFIIFTFVQLSPPIFSLYSPAFKYIYISLLFGIAIFALFQDILSKTSFVFLFLVLPLSIIKPPSTLNSSKSD